MYSETLMKTVNVTCHNDLKRLYEENKKYMGLRMFYEGEDIRLPQYSAFEGKKYVTIPGYFKVVGRMTAPNDFSVIHIAESIISKGECPACIMETLYQRAFDLCCFDLFRLVEKAPEKAVVQNETTSDPSGRTAPSVAPQMNQKQAFQPQPMHQQPVSQPIQQPTPQSDRSPDNEVIRFGRYRGLRISDFVNQAGEKEKTWLSWAVVNAPQHEREGLDGLVRLYEKKYPGELEQVYLAQKGISDPAMIQRLAGMPYSTWNQMC